MVDYGEFEEVSEDGAVANNSEQGNFVRARIPRQDELIGVIQQRLGGNRMDVLATDGKNRNCRVPGKYRRALWLRPGDFVIIVPWKDDDKKGDVIYKYSSSQVIQLRKRGLINNLKNEF
jgi:translation initiation factor 1A